MTVLRVVLFFQPTHSERYDYLTPGGAELSGSELEALFRETIARHVSPEPRVVEIRSWPIAPSSSGGDVLRHEVTWRAANNRKKKTRLVTKLAGLVERKTWRLLNRQHQPNVPFSHAMDYSDPQLALLCIQDVGDARRPTSLEPITGAELALEAKGLASIHLASLGKGEELKWLPRIDRASVARSIDRMWRPAWTKVRADAEFNLTFAGDILAIEDAAEAIVDDVGALVDEADSLTLIHNDVNPSNVLVHRGKPFFIDWQSAAFGPWYLDLPHHHSNLNQAEHYRREIAGHGSTVSAISFAERYRVAARYIGLRYMWWTLDNWQTDHSQTAWVQHYLGLVTGRV